MTNAVPPDYHATGMDVDSPSTIVCPLTNSDAPPPPMALEIATATSVEVDAEEECNISEAPDLSKEGDGVNFDATMPSQQSNDAPDKPPPTKKSKHLPPESFKSTRCLIV